MRERSKEDSTFPYWVALGSLGFALVLFLSNTVPAVRERQKLQAVRGELDDRLRSFREAIRATAAGVRLGGERGSFDLQALLVAIDDAGFTPTELCAAYPDPVADTDSR